MSDATDYGRYAGLVRELEDAGLRIESTGSDWCTDCMQDYDPQIVGWLGDLEIVVTRCAQSLVWDMQITRIVDGVREKGSRRFLSDDRADMAMMVRGLRAVNKGEVA